MVHAHYCADGGIFTVIRRSAHHEVGESSTGKLLCRKGGVDGPRATPGDRSDFVLVLKNSSDFLLFPGSVTLIWAVDSVAP